MSTIDTYLANNADFAAAFSDGELGAPPAREIAIVACMDARLDPARALGIDPGEAHVIRNAGGIVTEDVIRSLAISQNALGTREILLLHHTRCGMERPKGELEELIEERTGTRPEMELGTFENLEVDVRESIERLRASPLLVHKDVVRGFVYEVETGRVREVGT